MPPYDFDNEVRDRSVSVFGFVFRFPFFLFQFRFCAFPSETRLVCLLRIRFSVPFPVSALKPASGFSFNSALVSVVDFSFGFGCEIGILFPFTSDFVRFSLLFSLPVSVLASTSECGFRFQFGFSSGCRCSVSVWFTASTSESGFSFDRRLLFSISGTTCGFGFDIGICFQFSVRFQFRLWVPVSVLASS